MASLRQLSHEGRALLSTALVGGGGSGTTAPADEIPGGAGGASLDRRLAIAQRKRERARAQKDVCALADALHSLAAIRFHYDLKSRALSHSPSSSSLSLFIALGHALKSQRIKPRAETRRLAERIRHRLDEIFLRSFRIQKERFRAVLGPCHTIEGWYVHNLLSHAPDHSRRTVTHFCPSGHRLLTRRDLERYDRKIGRLLSCRNPSEPERKLVQFYNDIVRPALVALQDSAAAPLNCRTCNDGNSKAARLFCPQCAVYVESAGRAVLSAAYECEACASSRPRSLAERRAERGNKAARPVQASCGLETVFHYAQMGETPRGNAQREVRAQRRECASAYASRPLWDENMLLAIHDTSRLRAEALLNSSVDGAGSDPSPLPPAVVVCEPADMPYVDYGERSGVEFRDAKDVPVIVHSINQLSGGRVYSASSPLLCPTWCLPFLPNIIGDRKTPQYNTVNMYKILHANDGNTNPWFFFPTWGARERGRDRLSQRGSAKDDGSSAVSTKSSTLLVSRRCIGGMSQPDPRLDVFHTRFAAPLVIEVLRHELHALALATQDRPMPQYWNIIDPNLCVSQQRLRFNDPPPPETGKRLSVSTCVFGQALNEYHHQWIATDVVVEENVHPRLDLLCALQLCIRRTFQRATRRRNSGTQDTDVKITLPRHLAMAVFSYVDHEDVVRVGRAKICSRIHWLPPIKYAPLYVACEKVLTAALPALARLRRPALLLPGPLQVVIKSQRMMLGEMSQVSSKIDGHGDKDDDDHYAGCWHKDGRHEAVVAVVLYYFDKQNLVGGDLEFVEQVLPGTEPAASRIATFDNIHWRGESNFSKQDAQRAIDGMARARVPIDEGTLVVFSNYQCLHRVLRMERVRQKQRGGGRQVGSRDFLAFFVVDQRHPLQSSLNRPGPYASRIPKTPKSTKREMGRLREALLSEQLLPAGEFGLGRESVYSTGNGSAAVLGFLPGSTTTSRRDRMGFEEWAVDTEGFFFFDALNKKPPLLRGASWAAEDEAALQDDSSPWFCEVVRGENGEEVKRVYTNSMTGEERQVEMGLVKAETTGTPWKEGVSHWEIGNERGNEDDAAPTNKP